MSVAAALLAMLALLLARPPASRPPPSGPAAPVKLHEPGAQRRRGAGGAIVAGIGAGAGVWLVAPGWLALGALPVGGAVWHHVRSLESAAARRHREAVADELPHVVDLLRAMVVGGASPDHALRSVSAVVSPETRRELRPWVGRLELGSDPAAVWSNLSGHPQLGRLGVCMHRALATGATVSGALERLADDLRATRRADVARRVRQVEVKAAVPLGVCLLPAFVLVGVVPLVASAMTALTFG